MKVVVVLYILYNLCVQRRETGIANNVELYSDIKVTLRPILD